MQHRYTSKGQSPPWRQYDVIQLWEDQDATSLPPLPPLPPWSTVPSKRGINDDEEDESCDGEYKRFRGRLPTLEVSSPVDDPTPLKTGPHIASPSTDSTDSPHAASAGDRLNNTSPVGNPSSKSASPYTAIKQIIKNMQNTSMGPKSGTDTTGGWYVSMPTKARHTESSDNIGPMPLPELEPQSSTDNGSSDSSNSEEAATSSRHWSDQRPAPMAHPDSCHHSPRQDIGNDQATIRCLRAELKKTTRERDSLQIRLDKQTAKLAWSDEQVDKLRTRNNNQKVALRSLEAKINQDKTKAANGEGQGKKEKAKTSAKTSQRLLEENGQLQLKLKDQKATIAVLGSELKDLKAATTHRGAISSTPDLTWPRPNEPWQVVDDQSVLDQLATLKAEEEWWKSEKQLLEARVADADRWREEKEAEWISDHTAWERERVDYERRLRAFGHFPHSPSTETPQ